MEDLIKFLAGKKDSSGKNYKIIDITKSVTSFEQHIKYTDLLEKRPNVIAYYKRNATNNDLFHPYIIDCPNTDMNLMILFKDKYFALIEPKELTNHLVRTLNKFLEDDALYCGVCMEHKDDINLCEKCSYILCYDCCKSIDESTTDLMKCPNCREVFGSNDSAKNGELHGTLTLKQAQKYGFENGGSFYTKDGVKFMVIPEKQMKKMNLI